MRMDLNKISDSRNFLLNNDDDDAAMRDMNA
jgi:hypothetical protein